MTVQEAIIFLEKYMEGGRCRQTDLNAAIQIVVDYAKRSAPR
jgi:hypothetical protein